MNSTIFVIGIFSAIVSIIGTMVGALIGVSLKNPTNKLLGMLLSVATGIIISIIFLELIPESIDKIGFIRSLIVIIIGIVVVYFIDSMIGVTGNKQGENKSNTKHTKVAILMALGLMMHNFPEGIIMGFGFVKGSGLGIKMSILISIHDIPEGIAMTAPLIAAGKNPLKILWYSFLVAFPTIIGAWIGILLNNISNVFLGYSIAFASGIMIYVAFGQMLPESNELRSGYTNAMWIILGIIFGFVMINLF
ncbi:MAG: ZIP family metal transporter [Clostridium sp.]|uniref:ZIP family metal transporter n=1 Tax=Clostridium sp. TaxID=1506 RepID=UPI00305A8DF0